MENDFLSTMDGLVSNDKQTRESALSQSHIFMLKLKSNHEEYYRKIWKSLFYFFWNADKPDYQLAMSKRIAGFIFKHMDDSSSDFIDNVDIWINCFINEFIKKFSSIDFLRLDKYLMLNDQVMSVYLQSSLSKKKFGQINKFIEQLNLEINNHNYNYSFEANALKTIGRFIVYVLKEKEQEKFVKSNWKMFLEKLLKLYVDIKDKREIKTFEEVVFAAIKNNIHGTGIEKETKEKVDEFIKEKGNLLLLNAKKKAIENLVKKIEDEKYEPEIIPEEGIIDPVNNYIMKKNYTCKFRKSPLEKMKQIIKKEKEEKKKKKEQKEKEIEEEKNNVIDTEKIKEKVKDKKTKEQSPKKPIIIEEDKKLEGPVEEILAENIIDLNEETKDSKVNKKDDDHNNKDDDDEDDELIENEAEEGEQEDDNDGEEDEEDEMEDDNLIPIEEDESNDEIDGYVEDDEEYEEFDDDDDDDDDLHELMEIDNEINSHPSKEEDKNIEKAYRNSIKNMNLLRPSNKSNQFLGKKTKGKQFIPSNPSKKKDNNNPSKTTSHPKKVKYALENNITSIYDHKKPILLTSQKKSVFPDDSQPIKKSLLRNKK